MLNIALAARAEFDSDALLGTGTHAFADIRAIDHQVPAVQGNAANQNMDMRVVGIPVIDRHPVEPGVEVARHIFEQFARESAQVGHLACVFRRHDEAEVMPVVFAARGEGIAIDLIRQGIEHLGIRSVTGDAVPFEIGDVAGERCRAEMTAPVTNDARLDDDPPLESMGAASERSTLAAPPVPGPAARPASPERCKA